MCWCEAVNMFLIASTCVNVFDLQPWIFGRSAPNITGGLSRALHLGWCPTGRKSNSGKRRHSSDVRYRDLDKIIAVRRDLGCMSRRRYVKTWFFYTAEGDVEYCWIQSLMWFTVDALQLLTFGTLQIDAQGPWWFGPQDVQTWMR